MGMYLAMTCINHKPFKIRLVHQDFKDLFPNSFVSPPTESLIYGSPFPVARRQVPPRCSCAQNPENTVDKSAIVFSDAAPLATLPRQVRFQQLPCSVTYVVPLLFVRHGNTSLSFCAPIILYYSCKHYLENAKKYIRLSITRQEIFVSWRVSVSKKRQSRFFEQACMVEGARVLAKKSPLPP